MTRVIGYIRGIISKPTFAFRAILKDRPFVFVLSLVIVLGICGSAIAYFSTSELITEMKVLALLFPLICLLLWFIVSLLLYLGCRRLGGKATFKDALLVIGIANIAWIMFGLISCIMFILIRFVHIEALAYIAKYIPIGYIFILWFLALVVIGTREAQGFSTSKAIGSIMIATLYTFGILIFLLLVNYIVMINFRIIY